MLSFFEDLRCSPLYVSTCFRMVGKRFDHVQENDVLCGELRESVGESQPRFRRAIDWH
jgi:hypothetical protein